MSCCRSVMGRAIIYYLFFAFAVADETARERRQGVPRSLPMPKQIPLHPAAPQAAVLPSNPHHAIAATGIDFVQQLRSVKSSPGAETKQNLPPQQQFFPQQQFSGDPTFQAQRLAQQQATLLQSVLRSLNLNMIAGMVGQGAIMQLLAEQNLKSGGSVTPSTLLAPSDDAFGILPAPFMARMQVDREKADKLMRYHVLPGAAPASVITNDLLVNTMLPGKKLRFNVYGSGPQQRVTANGVLVLRLNAFNTRNLVIHVLDRVLFPYPRGDIASTIFTENCTVFEGMATGLFASGLDDFFRTSLPGVSFTLFMPTNQAFDLVPKKIMSKILTDSDKIEALLLSHTVNGTFYSQGLRDGQWLTTASQYQVPVWVGVVTEGNHRRLDSVNGQVRVVMADIPTDNGVIHLIDRPINPVEIVELFRCESDLV